MLPALRYLTQESDKRREAARLWDLWRNAERRASQGRFDDATARVYRLLEWTAQWQLLTRLGPDADTANFPRELLPASVAPSPDHDGKIKLGLWFAWQVVGGKLQGPARELITGHGEKLRDLLFRRNNSILAHGFHPVQRSDWEQMRSWMQERFLPVLGHLTLESGLQQPPGQLPTEPTACLAHTKELPPG